MLAYAACVWFSIVYLADHYVVDVIGGFVYASVAYCGDRPCAGLVPARRRPGRRSGGRRGRGLGEAGDRGAFRRAAGRVRWTIVRQGALIAAVGIIGIVGVVKVGWLGGADSVGSCSSRGPSSRGIWRAALGAISR